VTILSKKSLGRGKACPFGGQGKLLTLTDIFSEITLTWHGTNQMLDS